MLIKKANKKRAIIILQIAGVLLLTFLVFTIFLTIHWIANLKIAYAIVQFFSVIVTYALVKDIFMQINNIK